jgi:hypothetical protein
MERARAVTGSRFFVAPHTWWRVLKNFPIAPPLAGLALDFSAGVQ